MTTPNDYRDGYHAGVTIGRIRDVVIVVVAVLLTIWTLTDDTLPDWLVRLSFAGAIVAGLTLALGALHRLSGRP
jgi:hypothetical protein